MPDLTPELNLPVAVDDDDTADYLVISLADALAIIDGLFNSATGHNHNGAHQGGPLVDLLAQDLVTIAADAPQKRWSFAAARLLLPSGVAYPNDPAPVDGDVFYRTDLNKLAVYDASAAAWVTSAATYEDLVFGTASPATASYAVVTTVSYVFTQPGNTGVVLPDPTTATRAITVRNDSAVNCTITATGGSAITGGSINGATGAVMNGTIVPADSVTYKSNGTTWRMV